MAVFDWRGVELPENLTVAEVERCIRQFKREFANAGIQKRLGGTEAIPLQD